jgi:hypothetical protein
MGSTIHPHIHEGEGDASLGRACAYQEEETDMDQERRRGQVPIQGIEIWRIDDCKTYSRCWCMFCIVWVYIARTMYYRRFVHMTGWCFVHSDRPESSAGGSLHEAGR